MDELIVKKKHLLSDLLSADVIASLFDIIRSAEKNLHWALMEALEPHRDHLMARGVDPEDLVRSPECLHFLKCPETQSDLFTADAIATLLDILKRGEKNLYSALLEALEPHRDNLMAKGIDVTTMIYRFLRYKNRHHHMPFYVSENVEEFSMSDISRVFEEVGKLDGAQKTEFLAMLKSLVRERPHLRIRIAAFQQDWNWLSKFSNGIRRLGEKFDDKDAPDAPAEERITFDVVLKPAGVEKIPIIKNLREVTLLGLKEAKQLAYMGGTVMEGLDKEVAEAVRKNLENAGADAELQPSHIVMGMHSPHLLSGCFWCREQDDPGE